MDVEVRHLRALVALEDTDTFTTAAAVLGTTQPTLSRTIAQLEQITGVALVERTTRWVRFTAAGRRLASQARVLLVQLDNALSQVHDEAVRPLRLGWAWAGLGAHTVPLLQRWRHISTVLIEPSRPPEPSAALLRGDIDAAIVRCTPPSAGPPAGLHKVTLFTEDLVTAVASTSPVANQTAVYLADLAAGPIVMCATAPTATVMLWEHTGRTPHTITVANTDEWLSRIALGDAFGLTSATTPDSYQHPGVVYRPMKDSPPVEVALMWPSTDPHPHADAFANFARDYFTRL